jgi:hypothetical protein
MYVLFILHKNEGQKPAFPSTGIGLDNNENWYFVGNELYEKCFIPTE